MTRLTPDAVRRNPKGIALAASFILYDNFNAVCGQKVRFVLEEKGLPYERVEMNLRAGETLKPDYLALNPNGVVPTLVHDGRPVIESTLIGEYLDEAFPEPRLAPVGPHGRVRMRIWTKFVDESLHPACGSLTWAITIRPDMLQMEPAALEAHLAAIPDKKRQARQRTALEKGLHSPDFVAALETYRQLVRDMEAALGQRRWLAGERLSLADIGVLPYIVRLDMLSLSSLWRDDARSSAIERWYQALRERDAFRTCFLNDYPKAYVERMAARGAAARLEIGDLSATVSPASPAA